MEKALHVLHNGHTSLSAAWVKMESFLDLHRKNSVRFLVEGPMTVCGLPEDWIHQEFLILKLVHA